MAAWVSRQGILVVAAWDSLRGYVGGGVCGSVWPWWWWMWVAVGIGF